MTEAAEGDIMDKQYALDAGFAKHKRVHVQHDGKWFDATVVFVRKQSAKPYGVVRYKYNGEQYETVVFRRHNGTVVMCAENIDDGEELSPISYTFYKKKGSEDKCPEKKIGSKQLSESKAKDAHSAQEGKEATTKAAPSASWEKNPPPMPKNNRRKRSREDDVSSQLSEELTNIFNVVSDCFNKFKSKHGPKAVEKMNFDLSATVKKLESDGIFDLETFFKVEDNVLIKEYHIPRGLWLFIKDRAKEDEMSARSNAVSSSSKVGSEIVIPNASQNEINVKKRRYPHHSILQRTANLGTILAMLRDTKGGAVLCQQHVCNDPKTGKPFTPQNRTKYKSTWLGMLFEAGLMNIDDYECAYDDVPFQCAKKLNEQIHLVKDNPKAKTEAITTAKSELARLQKLVAAKKQIKKD